MTASPGPARGPLHGVRVVELGGIGPAPFAAMMLADLGADVVRVHRVGETAEPNAALDRGRRSIAVQLKDPRGVDVVRELAAGADALIEGFRPGVLERLGLGPRELHAANPALVIGRMTGYGQDGPFAPRAGHDINYIALSGALAAIGPAGHRPTPPINLVGDFGGGGMPLALGVVSAVLSARATGRGQVVDAAMVEGAASLMAMIYGFHGRGQWSVRRGENLFDSGAPWYDTYACADGRHVAVGALEPQFFAVLLERLGLSERIDADRQLDRDTWPHQRAEFEAAFAAHPRAHWESVFADVDACVTPVLDMDEAPAHPHNAARGAFVTLDGVTQPAPAPRFSGTPNAAPAPAPAVGAHTDELLADLGRDADQIAQLRADGVVG
ncbi:CaiB/BaiF CoA transferase family protein [Piscicoccus intestinalis]|uniref:CaiB/BaiF CoA transferase family protein n=1 Tax=Piscicoccus intestinalis TaxID=746033 RepID=UPI00083854F6|nr:CaiB/BaiF CoA-transferase family protein [Piscicoccus intestinalis]